MKKITKIIAIVLAMVMLVVCFAGCNKKTDDPDATAEPTASADDQAANYAAETTAFVAKVGDALVYESEFYYFLYNGIREIYVAADGLYDETLSDDENMQRLIDYFKSEAEDGETYIQKAVNIALDACVGFKIATSVGKKAADSNEKYVISNEKIQDMVDYIYSEAEYAAGNGYDADEYFLMYYGMNVNDAIRYSKQQMYAEMGETAWTDETGWTIGMDLPTAPEEPLEPEELSDDATDEQKAEYEETKKKYDEEVAAYPGLVEKYEADMKEYEEKEKVYWEKFREYYEEGKDDYDIPTLRYLYLEKGDNAESVRASAQNYIKYFESGESFEALVKGFSKSATATEDLGLVDIDLYDSDADYNLPNLVLEWADSCQGVTDYLEIVETEDALYIVKIEGYTTFDASTGIQASESTTNKTVRENVEYVVLADLYNTYIQGLMENDEYKVTETNNDRMLELANEYLNYSA